MKVKHLLMLNDAFNEAEKIVSQEEFKILTTKPQNPLTLRIIAHLIMLATGKGLLDAGMENTELLEIDMEIIRKITGIAGDILSPPSHRAS